MELLETEFGQALTDNDEYRQLLRRHREYERQLEQIASRRPFTQHDWFEESQVKKRKLRIKDQLQALGKHELDREAQLAS